MKMDSKMTLIMA